LTAFDGSKRLLTVEKVNKIRWNTLPIGLSRPDQISGFKDCRRSRPAGLGTPVCSHGLAALAAGFFFGVKDKSPEIGADYRNIHDLIRLAWPDAFLVRKVRYPEAWKSAGTVEGSWTRHDVGERSVRRDRKGRALVTLPFSMNL
jgi:hypothetical protein